MRAAQVDLRGFGVWTTFFGNSTSSVSLKVQTAFNSRLSSFPQRHSRPQQRPAESRVYPLYDLCLHLRCMMWVLQSPLRLTGTKSHTHELEHFVKYSITKIEYNIYLVTDETENCSRYKSACSEEETVLFLI